MSSSRGLGCRVPELGGSFYVSEPQVGIWRRWGCRGWPCWETLSVAVVQGSKTCCPPALCLWTVSAHVWNACRGKTGEMGEYWEEGSSCSRPLPHLSPLCLDPALPVPLAGALVLPPVQSQAAGHAWLSLDTHCHLHYEVLLAGLGGSEQGTVTAHLLGPPGMPGPRRLLKGFYGPEVRT